jgi:hypothetical protein
MSIDSNTSKDERPFGGVESYEIRFLQLEFRPSERRRSNCLDRGL